MAGRQRPGNRVTTGLRFRPQAAEALNECLFSSWSAFQQQIISNMSATEWPLTCPRTGASSPAHKCSF